MLHIIDILKAAASRETGAGPSATASDIGGETAAGSDDVRTEAENSRSPVSMSRRAVRADLARMMDAFGVRPDNLPLYQDELVEAEYTCALCRHVGRCRAWSAKGCKGDAPRLFCANAALFEEITPDPFWSETVPGRWHTAVRTSPVLRLLASESAASAETPPRLGARRLERFIDVALAIDTLLDRWSPSSDRPAQPVRGSHGEADLDTAIDDLFDQQGGFGKTDFARILQVALCDRRLAEFLCHLHDRSGQEAGAARPVAV